MKKHYDFGVGAFFLLWVAAAQAQQILAPGFGHELSLIPWQSWGWVVLFGAIGTMARIHAAIKAKEVELTAFDIVTWVSVGLLAALIAFAACEYVKEITGRRVPDLLEGAIISTAAYNRQSVIGWFADKLSRFKTAWAGAKS